MVIASMKAKLNYTPVQPFRRNSRIGIQYEMMRQPTGASVQEIMLKTGCSKIRIRGAVSEIRQRVGAANVVTHSYGDDTDQTRYEVLRALRQEQIESLISSEKSEQLIISWSTRNISNRTPVQPFRQNSRIGIQYEMMRQPTGASVQEIMLKTGCSEIRLRGAVSEIRRRVGAENVVTHSGSDSVEQTRYEVVQAIRQEQMEVSMISEKAEILSIEDDEDFDLAEQIRQAFADTPKVVTSWFNGFCEDNSQFAELLKDLFILDEDSYSKKRHLLDIMLCDKIDEYKYCRLKVGLYNNDPIRLLKICPNWLLEMEMKFFECSVRTTNVFREQGYPNLKALLRLKSSELLSLPNFGRTSLYCLFDEIHAAVIKGRLGNKTTSLFWFEAFWSCHGLVPVSFEQCLL